MENRDLQEFATGTTLKELFDERQTLVDFWKMKIDKEPEKQISEGEKSLESKSAEEEETIPGDIVFFYDTDQLELALNVMTNRNILSAPVFKKLEAEDKSLNSFLGFVEARDAVSYIVSHLPPLSVLSSNDLSSLASVLNSPLSAVLAGKKHEETTINENQTLLDALEAFAKGIHILALVGKDNEITGVVSQIDVARSCSMALSPDGLLKELAQTELKDIQNERFLSREVEKVSATQTVLEALNIVSKSNVSAIPIVDISGRLVGNFSASDVRGLVREKDSLLGNVYGYVSTISPLAMGPRAVILKSKFGDAVTELLTDQIHRLWIVDKDFSPSGCFSLTDVCGIFLESIKGKKEKSDEPKKVEKSPETIETQKTGTTV